MKTNLKPWWESSTSQADDESSLVVEFKFHDPASWKVRIFERLSVLFSEAWRDLLERVKDGLNIEFEKDATDKVAYADLTIPVNPLQEARIQKRLAENTSDLCAYPPKFVDSYRFIQCQNGFATSRIAMSVWREKLTKDESIQAPKKKKKKPVLRREKLMEDGSIQIQQRFFKLNRIPDKFFQGLLMSYMKIPSLELLPAKLRSGVCQKVAENISSHIELIDSSRVKNAVSFPSIKTRDPNIRRMHYVRALEALEFNPLPFETATQRELDPKKYKPDDPKGDRVITTDKRWTEVTESADPRLIPLHFLTGDAVYLMKGSYEFDAGISKKDRHRGFFILSEKIRKSRPQQLQTKGKTCLEHWYAALPILDCNDHIIQETLKKKSNSGGSSRGLDMNLRPFPIMAHHMEKMEDEFTLSNNHMLVPLSGDRKRNRSVLHRRDLRIALSKVIRKRNRLTKEYEWFLQITLKVPIVLEVFEPTQVLGVTFGIDASAHWTLIERTGTVVEIGAVTPNKNILKFLEKKSDIEWDQAKGRWFRGKKKFYRQLESIAHEVSNHLIEVAREHEAFLSVEDIAYLPKSGPNVEQNVIFTAFNCGQLKRHLGYKGPLAGIGNPFFVSDYNVNFTCPHCGAKKDGDETKENAATWKEDSTLHCRNCSATTMVDLAYKSLFVAKEGLKNLLKKRKR